MTSAAAPTNSLCFIDWEEQLQVWFWPVADDQFTSVPNHDLVQGMLKTLQTSAGFVRKQWAMWLQ